MSGFGSSSWPTAVVTDAAQAAQWTTPSHSDGTRGGTGITEGMSGSSLTQNVAQWPSPAARDYRTENKESYQERFGHKKGEQLPNAVAHSFSRPDLPMPPLGPTLSQLRPIWRPLRAWVIASHGRHVWRRLWAARDKDRLNPAFVAWLMGWPPGHHSCDCSATEWSRWQQRMRGALSQLPTASGPWIWKPPAPAPAETWTQTSMLEVLA